MKRKKMIVGISMGILIVLAGVFFKERKLFSGEDTTKPTITLKKQIFEVMEGGSLKASDIIAKVEDESGIASVSFQKEDNVEGELDENGIPNIKITYKNEGSIEDAVIAADPYGNIREVSFRVNVKTNLIEHVKGIKDLTVEEDTVVNWLEHISYDEKIKTVIYNANRVENKPGTYPLVYTIIGSDEAVMEQEVQVTVTEKKETIQQSITNEQEACDYIKRYLEKENADIPMRIEFDSIGEYGYVIHGYDMVDFHTATSFWYAVSSTGRIYDIIMAEYIK